MPREAATSVDVAARAGVSQSAVSRVFTPGAPVSEKTAAKVRKAARDLHYRPNNLARGLITGRSRIIGLVAAYLENQFYPDALERLSHALQANGYHVLIFMAPHNSGNIDGVLEEILDYQVDGIVMASAAMSSDLAARCEGAGVPVVLFNRSQDNAGLTAVTSDNIAGGRKAAEFLADGGHQKIGYIAGWEGASTQRDREAGFVEGLAQRGLRPTAREIGDFNFETACAAARAMFGGARRPDAVFVANDHMAFAVMDTLRFELGLDVPGDVSVFGYDDVPLAAWPSYNLTTVRQPSGLMAEETVKALKVQIETGTRVPRRIAIDGPLIVRGSARIPDERRAP